MILAESSNYIIYNEYEIAYLKHKGFSNKVRVAEMYGDPIGAYISDDEKYCLIFGCGIVVYKLCRPFKDYICGNQCKQWVDFFIDDGIWFLSILHVDAHNILIESENNGIYSIKLDSMTILKV